MTKKQRDTLTHALRATEEHLKILAALAGNTPRPKSNDTSLPLYRTYEAMQFAIGQTRRIYCNLSEQLTDGKLDELTR